jgi:hypothetical protein
MAVILYHYFDRSKLIYPHVTTLAVSQSGNMAAGILTGGFRKTIDYLSVPEQSCLSGNGGIPVFH